MEDDRGQLPQQNKEPVKKLLAEIVNDTRTCAHRFILRGIREAVCPVCGLGVFIDGIEDYERIKASDN